MTLAASTSTDKSLKDFDELMSTLIDFSGYILNGLKIENLTQEILLGPAFRLLKVTHSNYAELEYDFEECYKALLEKLDWENPEGGDYPFDLSKPLPLIKRGKRQRVLFEFFISSIEDMVPNIWSLVKAAYDRYALWGISHWRQQRIMSRFKEGDFPRLQINDIEDMLILMVQNWLTNLSGDDIADFAIALRMFTRSLVIQKRELMRSDECTSSVMGIKHDFFLRLQRDYQEYQHGVLAKEKMEHIGKENSSFHDQGHQQAARGKEDDEEVGEVYWR
ncbi:hypothetical protein Tco_1353182 [Tanacetum coccineum]